MFTDCMSGNVLCHFNTVCFSIDHFWYTVLQITHIFMNILYVLRHSLMSVILSFCVFGKLNPMMCTYFFKWQNCWFPSLIYGKLLHFGVLLFLCRKACYLDAIVIHCVVYFCSCFNKVNLFKYICNLHVFRLRPIKYNKAHQIFKFIVYIDLQ